MLTERGGDHVAPLDEHDAPVVGELAEREVVDLVLGAQAVDVGVVQGDVPSSG